MVSKSLNSKASLLIFKELQRVRVRLVMLGQELEVQKTVEL
jgi:hypothetical protein